MSGERLPSFSEHGPGDAPRGLDRFRRGERTRWCVGCMTGTSIDGLDAALVEITGGGIGVRARFVRGVSVGLDEVLPPVRVGGPALGACELGARLRALASGEALTAAQIAALARDFALLHAGAAVRLVHESIDAGDSTLGGPSDLALVCVHGQTVFHAPPLSWQVFQPAPLVEALSAPVVFDLRQADLTHGGQGAPITPLADFVLLRDDRRARAVLNLGGFANATLLPTRGVAFEGVAQAAALLDADADDAVLLRRALAVRGMDLCACNQVLDACARRVLGRAFDEDGAAAAHGRIETPGAAAARDDLLALLRAQGSQRRSLGSGDEAGAWVERWAERVEGPSLLRAACAAVGGAIAEGIAHAAIAIGEPLADVLLAGGGARNRALVEAITLALRTHAPAARVRPTDDSGLPGAYREAACFAVLGALCQDGVGITLPAVTGVRAGPLGLGPIAGCWAYPADGATRATD